MVDRRRERTLFSALVDANPAFLGEPRADWTQPADEREFPDIVGRTAGAQRVGVELAEWLSEEQTSTALSTERAESSMLASLEPHEPNSTRHVGIVWLGRKPGARVRRQDANQFRSELRSCIADYDSRPRLWDSPSYRVAGPELLAYPILHRYLHGVTLHRRDEADWPASVPWIRFPSRGGAYSADAMLEALLDIVRRKTTHYATDRLGCDHLSLVVFYDRAWVYNSPVETLEFTFEDAVRIASDAISEAPGPFDSAFIFDATGTTRLFKIYPA